MSDTSLLDQDIESLSRHISERLVEYLVEDAAISNSRLEVAEACTVCIEDAVREWFSESHE